MEFPIIDFLQNALLMAQNSGSSESYCAVAQHGRGWQVVLVTVMSSGLAQSFKLFWKLVRHGQLDLRILAKTGGMPSSHSCCTMGMAVSVV